MPKKKKNTLQVQEVPSFIKTIAKILEVVSPSLTTKFASKLFTTPIKHKMPKREMAMDQESNQKKVLIPEINKEIVIYENCAGAKKVLLVHGWSGRGTQLFKIAEALNKNGFATISFDAPAHGKSKGNTSIMTEFIASIMELERIYGPFEFIIGHSLGGMSVLNAIKQNLQVKKAVIIGSGDIIQDVIDDFIAKLGVNAKFGLLLKSHFEKKFGSKMDDYSAYKAAKNITIPVLVIHDTDDTDVPVTAAHHIKKHLQNSELIITEGLGHRKILGNEEVLKKMITFLQ